MHLNASLSQVQSVQLNISPKMKQALYILQCSADELGAYLQQQAVENPVLDLDWRDSFRNRKKAALYSADSDFINGIGGSDESLETSLLSQLRLSGYNGRSYFLAGYLAGNLNEYGYRAFPWKKSAMHDLSA
ncbi:hypothetical protein G5B47_22970 [Paenibacillus sp. 7124]|uniref:RNA polymerase factor sigma-54 n=1 Tax=Paenibacillus apii TaxID=1850370 RepID=A0A6M1PNT9_9BACL|nr:hypothetical protein [Paenibacillus apii]NGM85269.1 hypothetical protein [Paenibacillus apii]NJJ41858.1 hypothetical protein [Paenibacillus apii]